MDEIKCINKSEIPNIDYNCSSYAVETDFYSYRNYHCINCDEGFFIDYKTKKCITCENHNCSYINNNKTVISSGGSTSSCLLYYVYNET